MSLRAIFLYELDVGRAEAVLLPLGRKEVRLAWGRAVVVVSREEACRLGEKLDGGKS